MRHYTLAPSARVDLENIAAYIRDAAGTNVAVQVLTRIQNTCLLLAQTPGELGPHRPEVLEGVRSFSIPPHMLFFRYTEKTVEIIRVLHQRQDIGRAFDDE